MIAATTSSSPPTAVDNPAVDVILVDRTARAPVFDLVVPIFNEADVLAASVERLTTAMADLPCSWRITIADNRSDDGSWDLARTLASTVDGVRAMRLDRKGRGLALRTAWLGSDATIVGYTDVDLSTDLAALLPLIAPLMSGHSDVAIGTRLGRGSKVVRGPKREFVSRSYNRILQGLARARFSDAQCGFKALRADRARQLLPLVENQNWFFDTELLLLSERNGLRIHEVAVDWVDDPDSTVDVVATAVEDLRGLARVGRRILNGSFRLETESTERESQLTGQIVGFAAVGGFTTILHLVLFTLWQDGLGSQWSNALALGLATVVNTFLNGWIAFGKRDGAGWLTAQAQAAGVYLIGLAVTSGALALLETLWEERPAIVTVGVLLVANGVVTIGRFLAMRTWIFRRTALQWRPVSGPVDGGSSV